ncbi:MAG: hypothetical protein JW850_00995, partial [Thermoflexales bacterium]|nr:hypothetical protein [Thermoflexales bacterium]
EVLELADRPRSGRGDRNGRAGSTPAFGTKNPSFKAGVFLLPAAERIVNRTLPDSLPGSDSLFDHALMIPPIAQIDNNRPPVSIYGSNIKAFFTAKARRTPSEVQVQVFVRYRELAAWLLLELLLRHTLFRTLP